VGVETRGEDRKNLRDSRTQEVRVLGRFSQGKWGEAVAVERNGKKTRPIHSEKYARTLPSAKGGEERRS